MNFGIEVVKYNLLSRGIIIAKFGTLEQAKSAMAWIKSKQFGDQKLEVNFLIY
jgi:hypothetical protein